MKRNRKSWIWKMRNWNSYMISRCLRKWMLKWANVKKFLIMWSKSMMKWSTNKSKVFARIMVIWFLLRKSRDQNTWKESWSSWMKTVISKREESVMKMLLCLFSIWRMKKLWMLSKVKRPEKRWNSMLLKHIRIKLILLLCWVWKKKRPKMQGRIIVLLSGRLNVM